MIDTRVALMVEHDDRGAYSVVGLNGMIYQQNTTMEQAYRVLSQLANAPGYRLATTQDLNLPLASEFPALERYTN